MSVEEIVRYVRQTPGNTNPSVVGSMVNAEMNSTLKAAKEYTDSQRMGYESIEILVNDESNPAVDIFGEGILYTKISDVLINVADITEIRAVAADGSVDITFSTKNLLVVKEVEGFGEIYISKIATDHLLLFVLEVTENDLTPGVYVLSDRSNSGAIVTEVKYKKVHQIDQKFIPNTVINLCDCGINLYEYLQIATTTGKLSGRVSVPDCKENFWKKIPRDGSQFTIVNDDGVNNPLIFYNVFTGLNRITNRYGTVSVSGTVYETTTNKIIDVSVYFDLWMKNDDSGVGGTTVYYIFKLSDPPTE